MTKSLIIGDNDRHDTPEEVASPKKELFKNAPRRAYRMSETIDDLPPLSYASPYNTPSTKDSNFFKNKEVEREEKEERPK
jgi:hypothetical protein